MDLFNYFFLLANILAVTSILAIWASCPQAWWN